MHSSRTLSWLHSKTTSERDKKWEDLCDSNVQYSCKVERTNFFLHIISPQGPNWTSTSFRHCFAYMYYYYGISPTTRTTYSPGQTSYLKFCSMIQHTSIPANESTILLFVTHLTTFGLSYTTIKVCLSAIHSMLVATNQHYSNQQLTPRLQQVLHDYDKPKPLQIRAHHPGHHALR